MLWTNQYSTPQCVSLKDASSTARMTAEKHHGLMSCRALKSKAFLGGLHCPCERMQVLLVDQFLVSFKFTNAVPKRLSQSTEITLHLQSHPRKIKEL